MPDGRSKRDEPTAMRPGVVLLVGLVAAVALVVGLSALYWAGEGRPGTPAAFRESVADTGLVVEWDNSGPRGGTGRVDTACGSIVIDVQQIEGQLWVTWSSHREVLTPATAAAITACDP